MVEDTSQPLPICIPFSRHWCVDRWIVTIRNLESEGQVYHFGDPAPQLFDASFITRPADRLAAMGVTPGGVMAVDRAAFGPQSLSVGAVVRLGLNNEVLAVVQNVLQDTVEVQLVAPPLDDLPQVSDEAQQQSLRMGWGPDLFGASMIVTENGVVQDAPDSVTIDGVTLVHGDRILITDPLSDSQAGGITRANLAEALRIMPEVEARRVEQQRNVFDITMLREMLGANREPDAPAAISVPLGELPNTFIQGRRYLVPMDRLPPADRIRGIRADALVIDDAADFDSDFFSAVLGEQFGPLCEPPYNVTVEQIGHRVQLTWQCDDQDARFFLIERVIEDGDWCRVACVPGRAGLHTWRDPWPGLGMHAYRVTTCRRRSLQHVVGSAWQSDVITVHETIVDAMHSRHGSRLAPFYRTFRVWERAASGAINQFTRMHMREAGFMRRIMPPLAISNDELDRAVPTDRPVRVPAP